MSAEELAIFGIVVYFFQINRYFDIRKSAVDGVIQKYSSYFDPVTIKSKKKYFIMILTRGVAGYMDENKEIKKLIYQDVQQKKKDIDWIIVAKEIVKSFNSVIFSGDISIYMHNFTVNYYKGNTQKKEQLKLYTFIDTYFGQNASNCFEDIYKNFYNSIKNGVFVYGKVPYNVIEIIDRNDGKVKSMDNIIKYIIKNRRLFYFCLASYIFYEFAKPFINPSECKQDEVKKQEREDSDVHEDSQWSKYPEIPKISIEWLEDPRLAADDAEYIVAKNILIYAFYHNWFLCQESMIDKILDFLNDTVRQYGITGNVRQNLELLYNILVFLYNENARKNNIVDVVINEYDALYANLLKSQSIPILSSDITRKEAIERMAESTAKYLLSFPTDQFIEPHGYAYPKNSNSGIHMGYRMYFCTVNSYFIKEYGTMAVNAFIEWITKPYKISNKLYDLHKYVFILDNEVYEPIEYLLAIYDKSTDVFLSYGLHFLFEVLSKYRFLGPNFTRRSKTTIPYISVL